MGHTYSQQVAFAVIHVSALGTTYQPTQHRALPRERKKTCAWTNCNTQNVFNIATCCSANRGTVAINDLVWIFFDDVAKKHWRSHLGLSEPFGVKLRSHARGVFMQPAKLILHNHSVAEHDRSQRAKPLLKFEDNRPCRNTTYTTIAVLF